MHQPRRMSVGKARLGWVLAGSILATLTVSGAATAASSGSGDPLAADAYRKVAGAEMRVVKALSSRDGKELAATGAALGPVIEGALARRKLGKPASRCDLAAHSLAFLAINAAQALQQKGEAKRLLLQDAQKAARDFDTDMRACEAYIGRPAGSHTTAEKALRAL